MNLMQTVVNLIDKPCAVLTVERVSEKVWGDIRIACANSLYKTSMGGDFRNNMRYDELVPKMLRFENSCFRCAYYSQQVHTYVETPAMHCWTDQYLVPLSPDENGLGRCLFILEFTQTGEVDRRSTVSVVTAATVLKACLTMLGQGSLKERVTSVLRDLMEFSYAFSCRVILLDHANRRAVNYVDLNAIELGDDFVPPEGDPDQGNISYETVCSWADIIGERDALIISNEEELQLVEKLNPVWVQTMRLYGVNSLMLIPLVKSNEMLGYLYVCNFNVDKLTRIKELMELDSFILGSEIYNSLLLERLDRMSHMDALTGLNNRNAMIRRTAQISAAEAPLPFGIVNLDLNGLKVVNDLQGHDAGDRLLVEAAEMLKKYFYQDDLYRTGGDEFIVIATDITQEAFNRKVDRLRQGMAKEKVISFAMGSCWSDGTTVDLTTAFRRADEAMYADKKEYYALHPEQRR